MRPKHYKKPIATDPVFFLASTTIVFLLVMTGVTLFPFLFCFFYCIFGLSEGKPTFSKKLHELKETKKKNDRGQSKLKFSLGDVL